MTSKELIPEPESDPEQEIDVDVEVVIAVDPTDGVFAVGVVISTINVEFACSVQLQLLELSHT
jgi:hypothetical protein